MASGTAGGAGSGAADGAPTGRFVVVVSSRRLLHAPHTWAVLRQSPPAVLLLTSDERLELMQSAAARRGVRGLQRAGTLVLRQYNDPRARYEAAGRGVSPVWVVPLGHRSGLFPNRDQVQSLHLIDADRHQLMMVDAD